LPNNLIDFDKLLNIIQFNYLGYFKLTVVQNEMLKFISDNKFLIVYKGRQEGVSTAISVYILWKLINCPGCSIGMLYSSNNERENFRQMINMNLDNIEKIFKSLGIDMILTPDKHNENQTCLPNGSKIFYWSKNSKDALRGMSLDFIYVSELNNKDNFIYILQSLMPCLNYNKDAKFLITTSDLRNLKEDFPMNGDNISEYWSGDYFDGTRFVLIEKIS
jgi:hypothetical protein